MNNNDPNTDIYDTLSDADKEHIYRKRLMEYVCDDIHAHAESIDIPLTDDDINIIAERYVYNGDYDCNLSYWDNIDNLIQDYITR